MHLRVPGDCPPELPLLLLLSVLLCLPRPVMALRLDHRLGRRRDTHLAIARGEHLVDIQERILSELKLEDKPRGLRRVSSAELERGRTLYRRAVADAEDSRTSSQEADQEVSAATFHSISGDVLPISDHRPEHGSVAQRVLFNITSESLSSSSSQTEISRASLTFSSHLVIRRASQNTSESTIIIVRKLLDSSSHREIFTMQALKPDRLLHRIDLTELVKSWRNNPESNFGIEISVIGGRFSRRFLRTGADDVFNLDVVTLPHSSRQQRSTATEACEAGKCCKQTLHVEFSSIGWDDWIIEPSSFEANICGGSCPRHHRPATRHRTVLDLLRPEQPLGRCCAPRKWKTLPVLHMSDAGRLEVSELEGIIVEDCGCS